MHDLLIPFVLVGAVLMLSGLVSGLVRQAPISVPIIFLGIGFALGEGGLGILHVDVHDQALQVVGVLSLAFVLFLDAVHLRFDEGKQAWRAPMLALGPGTLLTIAIVAVAAMVILKVPPIEALLLGSILASIDPVVLRDVTRDERVPRSIRQILTTEAGTNDIVVLPAVLILTTVALGRGGGAEDWLLTLVKLFALGPLAGLVVGFVSVWLAGQVRQRSTISREYRAIYGVGAILVAYVAGELVGGSGFLAVFAAGAVVVLTDYDLCDCFLEYGEVTAEMTMLLAFVLFGALLSTLLGTVPLLPALLFAAVVLLIARPVAISLVLGRAVMSQQARLFMGWFGPRGLSSLLFALLVVSAHVPNAEWLLTITGVVVVASVIAHGVSATPLISLYSRAVAQKVLPEEREATIEGLFRGEPNQVPRITPETLAQELASDAPPIVLDVRSSAARTDERVPGAERVPPDALPEWIAGHDRDRLVVTYCT
ncbi:MAG: cation:proton antiporter [Thermomicrobiales bacterium]